VAEAGATRPFLIGVAGGSGSGKTTVAERLAGLIGDPELALLRLDAYYRDGDGLTFEERAAVNYDHPDAFDWPLLLAHVQALADGLEVRVPVYDFATYERLPERTTIAPSRVVVVEGILVLYEPVLREQFDLRVFVDTDADVRFIRRLERDVAERERSVASVIEQYLTTVRPSHEQFIEPSKRHADVIVPHGGLNVPALDVLLARVRELL
jgi:uridine kinase